MSSMLCVLLLGLLPVSPVMDDTADAIEVNHYFDQSGEPVFVQIIFWEWLPELGTYRVFAWRMVKSPGQVPVYDWWRRCYVTCFADKDALRRIRAPSVRDTWTQYDPELLDRQHLPQQSRRGLARESPLKEPFP